MKYKNLGTVDITNCLLNCRYLGFNFYSLCVFICVQTSGVDVFDPNESSPAKVVKILKLVSKMFTSVPCVMIL